MSTPTTPKKGLIDRVALASLVGLSVLAVLGVTTVTVYLNRLTDSTEALSRTAAMPAYMGRPTTLTADNGVSPTNVLILGTVGGSLRSVTIANVSASRRSLTLIVAPDELSPTGGSQTLASTFSMDPAITVRAVEGLTQARMDHQVQIDLTCLAGVIDATGGAAAAGAATTGQLSLQADTADPDANAVSSGAFLRAALIALDRHYSSLDPGRFANMIDLINPCMKVDADLSAQVIENAVMENSIHVTDTHLWPLATTTFKGQVLADPDAVAALRAALADPQLETTPQYHAAAILPKGP